MMARLGGAARVCGTLGRASPGWLGLPALAGARPDRLAHLNQDQRWGGQI